jgi:hypothetical protein
MLLRFPRQQLSTPRHSMSSLNDFFTYVSAFTPEAQLWKKAIQSDDDPFISHQGDRYFNSNGRLQTILEEKLALMLRAKEIESMVTLYVTNGLPERFAPATNSLASCAYISTNQLLNAGAKIILMTPSRSSLLYDYNSLADFCSNVEGLNLLSLHHPLPFSLAGENVIYLVKEKDGTKNLYSFRKQNDHCEFWLGRLQHESNQQRLREIDAVLLENGVETLEEQLEGVANSSRRPCTWGLR